VQDVFVRAMHSSRVPATDAERRPWLYRIATNLAIDELRRRRRFRFLPFSGREAVDPPTTAEGDPVRRALAGIPPEQAAALILRLHEGFTRAETAELLGLSEEGVKSRLARGRVRFTEEYLRLTRETRR